MEHVGYDAGTPPEAKYITASCGHEVYDGETLYTDRDGMTLCPDCVDERFDKLSTNMKAAMLEYEYVVVRFPEHK